MESILEFINRAVEFFNSGLYDWIISFFEQITYYYTIWVIKGKIFFATVAWEVAQSLLVNFNLSSLINSAWSSIDSTTMSYLNFFRLPECINILLQGSVTSFVIRLIA
jgi:hypothetical protein